MNATRSLPRLAATACLCLTPLAAARANPTGDVALDTETVRIAIGPRTVHVESRATFINRGAPCTVRLGYPGQGKTSFALRVDNKPAPFRVTPRADSTRYLCALNFAAGQRRAVTSRYDLPVTPLAAIDGSYYQALYALGAGASWRHAIRRTDITVTFDRPRLPSRLSPRPQQVLGEKYVENLPWSRYKAGTVIFDGLDRPASRGRRLHWARANWMPSSDDALALYWKE